VTKLFDVYSRLPRSLQHAAVSIKGLSFQYWRARPVLEREQLTWLMHSQWWPEEVWRQYQINRLIPYLIDSFTSVPFYRDLARAKQIDITDVRSLTDFMELPLLKKEAVRGNEASFVPDYIDYRRLQRGFTSGTTGSPMTIYGNRETFSRRWAFVARLRQVAGVSPHRPRRCQFTGRDISIHDQKSFWRVNIPGNSLLMSTTQINPLTAGRYVAAMRRWRPELIDGYPSAMLVLARYATDAGIDLPQPQAIITSAETLTVADRLELESRYRCKVFDQYASSEPSAFWSDCEHGSMHVNEEFGISEIVDKRGNPAEPGTTGNIITTAMVDSPFRLIRYEIGDVASLGVAKSCACGRTFRSIDAIDGRIEDVVHVPGRGAVGRLDPAFKGLSGIAECQIAQVSPMQFEVRIVKGADYKEATGLALTTNLRAKLGDQVEIQFVFLDQIARSANGKLRAVVREFHD
jgi:phenylacetate-CoA ligase